LNLGAILLLNHWQLDRLFKRYGNEKAVYPKTTTNQLREILLLPPVGTAAWPD
jgi:hypothetical protein